MEIRDPEEMKDVDTIEDDWAAGELIIPEDWPCLIDGATRMVNGRGPDKSKHWILWDKIWKTHYKAYDESLNEQHINGSTSLKLMGLSDKALEELYDAIDGFFDPDFIASVEEDQPFGDFISTTIGEPWYTNEGIGNAFERADTLRDEAEKLGDYMNVWGKICSEAKNYLIKKYDEYRSKNESLNEDTVKQDGKWVNKGKEGTHGEFDTKKEADAQRKAMFARGHQVKNGSVGEQELTELFGKNKSNASDPITINIEGIKPASEHEAKFAWKYLKKSAPLYISPGKSDIEATVLSDKGNKIQVKYNQSRWVPYIPIRIKSKSYKPGKTFEVPGVGTFLMSNNGLIGLNTRPCGKDQDLFLNSVELIQVSFFENSFVQIN